MLSTESSDKNISVTDSGWVKASNQQCILSGAPGEYYLYFKNKDSILLSVKNRGDSIPKQDRDKILQGFETLAELSNETGITVHIISRKENTEISV